MREKIRGDKKKGKRMEEEGVVIEKGEETRWAGGEKSNEAKRGSRTGDGKRK